ncbi:MAG: MOSC N-terminal beta barrel domain-containing protein, partial [Patescibacteria group bacterium]
MKEGEVIGNISKIAVSYIKGTGLTELESAIVTPRGIPGDREYVIVDAKPDQDGIHRWVSQRDRRDTNDIPQGLGVLALILPQYTSEALYLAWKDEQSDPLAVPHEQREEGDPKRIQIWEDVMDGAIDQGDESAEWLSTHLRYD